MKWMLLVFLVQNPLLPVETGMIFDSLDDCLKAEDTMRANYARAYNDWLTWAKAHQAEADYPTSDDFMKKRMESKRGELAFPTLPRLPIS